MIKVFKLALTFVVCILSFHMDVQASSGQVSSDQDAGSRKRSRNYSPIELCDPDQMGWNMEALFAEFEEDDELHSLRKIIFNAIANYPEEPFPLEVLQAFKELSDGESILRYDDLLEPVQNGETIFHAIYHSMAKKEIDEKLSFGLYRKLFPLFMKADRPPGNAEALYQLVKETKQVSWRIFLETKFYRSAENHSDLTAHQIIAGAVKYIRTDVSAITSTTCSSVFKIFIQLHRLLLTNGYDFSYNQWDESVFFILAIFDAECLTKLWNIRKYPLYNKTMEMFEYFYSWNRYLCILILESGAAKQILSDHRQVNNILKVLSKAKYNPLYLEEKRTGGALGWIENLIFYGLDINENEQVFRTLIQVMLRYIHEYVTEKYIDDMVSRIGNMKFSFSKAKYILYETIQELSDPERNPQIPLDVKLNQFKYILRLIKTFKEINMAEFAYAALYNKSDEIFTMIVFMESFEDVEFDENLFQ